MSSYRKTMAEALNQVREAQMVSDISGISITALKREVRKFNIQVARVTPGGGDSGAEYEVTFTGREQDLIKYAKEHLGFDDKPGNFMQLKKHLNMSYNDIEEISDKLKMKVKSSRLAQKIAKLKNTFLKKTIPGTGAMFAQKEEVELEEKFALYAIRPFFNRRKGTDAKKGDRVSGPMTYTQAVSKAKQMNVGSSIGGEKRVEIKPMKEEVEIEEGRMKDIFTADQEGKSAEEIAKLMKLPLKTVKSILGESDAYDNERYEIRNGKAYRDVGSTPDKKNHVYAPDKKTAEKIFKQGKKVFREETIVEFSDAMLDKLKREYEPLKGKTISLDQANKLRKLFKMIPDRALDALRKKKIPFLSGLALTRMIQKGMPVKEEIEEKIQAYMVSYSKNGQHAGFKGADTLPELQRMAANLRMRGFTIDKMGKYNPPVKKEEVIKEEEQDLDKIALAKEKDTDALEKQLTAAQGQIAVLKQKIENEKNKSIKPMPNPETGEIPLTIGLAHKLLNDKEKKEKEERNQKEISKQIKAASKGGAAPAPVAAETKLEAFTRKYLSYLNESEASDKAKAMGLDYMSFGRYGKGGKVTHKSVGGSLQALSKKDQEKEKEPKAKVAKPKTKTTGAISNPDGSKTTSGQIKKEILKKIDDEDIVSDPYVLEGELEDQFIALADDLRGTGDEETANKITDAIFAVGEDDPDTPAKIDDMMNALQGKPDVNGAKQKELSSMTSLYTDATYSSKSLKDFVSDTSSIINKMGELADAGSMESDAYGPGIRSDAMVEIGASASEIQDKIEEMDIDDDIKIDINAALSTITDNDADEHTEEGPIYLAIKDLQRHFGRLNKQKSKASSRATASSGVKKDLRKALKSAPEPGPDYDPKDYNELKNIAKKAGDKETVDIIDAMNKAHDDNDYSEVSYQYVELRKRIEESYLPEKVMTDKEKRLQRAKDMIKYYDAQKKAALKGKNKDLAKKMLKNDIEEADLSKKQIKMVHKVADDLPKKDFKDRYGKEKGDAVRFGTATNMVKKKLGMKEDRRLYIESIAGLKKKADKSGMPYSILKKVYDRGMAAWKSGHRPGASQQQWAFARVNSFVTKSSGTWGGADKDLAKQVRGK
jgi:hypothetical protein